jgi:hypothetical protein
VLKERNDGTAEILDRGEHDGPAGISARRPEAAVAARDEPTIAERLNGSSIARSTSRVALNGEP